MAALLVSFLSTNAFSLSRCSVSFCNRQLLRMTTTSSDTTASSNQKNSDLWETLLSRFQGDFDNYHQVLQDRQEGMLPKEGGGHEHIHCTLVPVANDARLAAFYFDGIPNAIFRFRYYHLRPIYNERNELRAVDTILYTLNPQLETQLRLKSTEPLVWPEIFRDFGPDRTILLPNCDVRWSWEMDPVQHSYAASYTSSQDAAGIHAIMVHGQAIVDSQMAPGTKILIKDQLSLWSDEFWIHDRGYDPDDPGKFIYGNQRGIPYRLDRVTQITAEGERTVTSEELQWTLGPSFRTDAIYKEKLDAIGGPSAKR